jgi:bifunctional non-homologous end joining protein LigD
MSDLFRSFQFEWLFPLVQGDRQHPGSGSYVRLVAIFAFFLLFFSTRPKEFF